MTFVKRTTPGYDPDEIIAALVVPLVGHRTEAVEKALSEAGVEQMSRLSEGVLSVRATRKSLDSVNTVARVEPKIPKQMHVK